jgi:hypothetical protein
MTGVKRGEPRIEVEFAVQFDVIANDAREIADGQSDPAAGLIL